MALFLGINNEGLNISSGINLASLFSSTTGVFKFRFLIELTYNLDNGNSITPVPKTISFTQQQTQSGEAIINLSQIYQSIVTPTIVAPKKGLFESSGYSVEYKSIHNLPTIVDGTYRRNFAWGIIEDSIGMEAFRGNANVMTLKFYEMFATTLNGIPVKDVATLKTKTIFMMWGRGQEDEGVIIDFDQYKMQVSDGDEKQFLSSNYNKINVNRYDVNIGLNEYHTISFFNRCAINVTAKPFQIHVEYFNSSDGTLGELEIENTTSSGGAYYSTASEGVDESFFLFAGIGLENLQKLNLSQSEYSGTLPDSVAGGRSAIAYYKVKMQDDASGTNQTSAEYRFNVVSYCDKYEQSRLAFMNRFGAWEYITLNKEKNEKLKITRESINKPLINQSVTLGQYGVGTLGASYPSDVAKQGMMTTSVKSEESFTLFTDNLKDYQIEQIKDLMMSPQIHLLEGAKAKALILETSDMKLKGDKNQGLFQYELKFKFASPKHRQTLS